MTRMDELQAELSARAQDRAQQYRRLVTSVADGTLVDAKKAESTLEAIGKTADDLRRDVERLELRRRMLNELARLPELVARQKAAEDALRDENTRWALLEKEHWEIEAPLLNTIEFTRAEISRANEAKRALIETAPDAMQQIHTIERQQRALQDELGELQKRLACNQNARESFEQSIADDTVRRVLPEEEAARREQIAVFRQRSDRDAETIRARIAELQKELNGTIERIDEITGVILSVA